MLKLSQVLKVPVLEQRASRRDSKGGDTGRTVPLGKVHNVVFSPDGMTVVGFLVKRPDVAGMIKREDLFVAIDAIDVTDEGIVCTQGKDSYDDRARERLGLDWDACIIWNGMDVRTRAGKELGYVTDVSFNMRSGRVGEVFVSDGSVANTLVGSLVLTPDLIVGYSQGYMVVKNEAASLALSGGVAEKAGEAAAKARASAQDVGKKAAKAAGEAVDKGSRSLGRAIGHVRRKVREATQEDPEVAEVPIEDATVTGGSNRALADTSPSQDSKEDANLSSDKHTTSTYVPISVDKKAQNRKNGSSKTNAKAKTAKTAKSTKSSKAAQSKKHSSKKSSKDDVARKMGRQLAKTKGMFAAFKEEFDKSSS